MKFPIIVLVAAVLVVMMSCSQTTAPTTAHQVGEVYGGGLVVSVSMDGSGVQHGLIISLNSLSSGAGWTRAGDMCKNFAAGGHNDWVVPDVSDLREVYDGLSVLNPALKTVGDTLGPHVYWTSREYDKSDAWYVSFVNGGANHASKAEAYRVRAVRRF